jgi:hypothetical protein
MKVTWVCRDWQPEPAFALPPIGYHADFAFPSEKLHRGQRRSASHRRDYVCPAAQVRAS